MSLLRVDSMPSVLIIDDKSYPVVTDFRGSVTSVINSKTGDVLFARDYDINGLKKIYYNKSDLKLAKEVENLTIWSFAHLFENPFLSNEDLYFSKTRTLSARNGEWLTFDPMIKWNVEQLLNSPVDFNGFKYVNGDPVNFVDPSGYFEITVFAGGQGSGGAGVGAGVSSGGWLEISTSPLGIDYGTYASGTFGAHFGASVGTGGEAGILFGSKDLLSGGFVSLGGSGGILGKAGADLLITPGGKDGYLFHKDTTFGLSVNLSFGLGVEAHSRVGIGKVLSSNSVQNNDFRFYKNTPSLGNYFKLEDVLF